MKILVLFSVAPMPPPNDFGGTKRSLPFLRELAKYHDVSVLSFGTPEQCAVFKAHYGGFCQEVRFVDRRRPIIINITELLWLLSTGRSSFNRIYRRSMQQALDEMTARKQYDLIHCCTQCFGFFRFPRNAVVTSDTHDVMHHLAGRIAKTTKNPLWKILKHLDHRFGKTEESKLCKSFHLLVTTTEKDHSLFKQLAPHQRMQVIQNGVDSMFLEDICVAPEPLTMTFTGLFTHLPNSDGIVHFIDHIFPLILKQEPGARVYVVGKSPPRALRARAGDNIIVTGFVDDVRPYIAKCQAFIIPLLSGSGIRTKALEAMAMRRPIVTTSLGVEGIHLEHGQSALFADSPADFADAVVRLFRDHSLSTKLAVRARQIVEQEYDWAAKGKELEMALSTAAKAAAPGLPGQARPAGVSPELRFALK